MVGSSRPTEPASVKDRIHAWQAQGGGVVEVEETQIKDDAKRKKAGKHTPEESPAPVTPTTEKEHVRVPSTPKTNPKDKIKEDKIRDSTLKTRSAPTKRVISDGHWRKRRSPPKGRSTSKPAKGDITQSSQPNERSGALPRSDAEAKELHGKRESSKSQNLAQNDGIRVYVTPPGSRRQSGHRTGRRDASPSATLPEGDPAVEFAEDSLDKKSSGRKTSLLGKISQSASSEAKAHGQIQRHRRQSLEDDTHVTLPARSVQRGSLRSEKGNLLSQVFSDSRKMFAKQAPEPVISPKVPSIEAWLDSTSDPFVETDPPMEAVTVLELVRKSKESEPLEAGVRDPNSIWDSLGSEGGGSQSATPSSPRRRSENLVQRKRRDLPNDLPSDSRRNATDSTTITSLPNDTSLGSPENSAKSLRRRAARKSVSSPVRNRERPQKSSLSTIMNEEPLTRHSDTSSTGGPDPQAAIKPLPLNIKRPFPSIGQHRLSTIASVDTLNTCLESTAGSSVPTIKEDVVLGPQESNDALWREVDAKLQSSAPKRSNSRLTKHSDLISVLSMPMEGSRSIKSARSIRTSRTHLEVATVDELMQELMTDESKYMRELRTLVDGVIPVLISCVLSKSDSAVAAGLFHASAVAPENTDFTRPIVDMGIALERLKSLHKRLPQKDSKALMTWARSATKIYGDYLKSWRLGFQDVVVNLATTSSSSPEPSKQQELDEGLPRDENGNVVNGDGEKVDVAFLLKRPLVRLKYLAKTLKGINMINPSPEAANLARKYQDLVDAARRRVDEEKARLEDEAAANIDATRSRDPRTLVPVSGVAIDRSRRVRARDNFDLALQHSTGQCIDCRVELLLRDEASETEGGGDVLICEVDGSGRWLLFPPVQLDLVSARAGDSDRQIVIMIRGHSSSGLQWQEMMRLCCEDEATSSEWTQMLGLEPVPPKLARSLSFTQQEQKQKHIPHRSSTGHLMSGGIMFPGKSRPPSPTEVEIPIGERANSSSQRWSSYEGSQKRTSKLSRVDVQGPECDQPSSVPNDLRSLPSHNQSPSSMPQTPTSHSPRTFKEALGLSGTSAMSGLRRTKAKRASRHLDGSPVSPRSRASRYDSGSCRSSPASSTVEIGPKVSSATSRGHKRERYTDEQEKTSSSPKLYEEDTARDPTPAPSPTASIINTKVRKQTPSSRDMAQPLAQNSAQDLLPENSSHAAFTRLTKKRPLKLSRQSKDTEISSSAVESNSKDSSQLDLSAAPRIEPNEPRARRSSSPLKHQYEPSTASDTPSDSEASTVERHEVSSMTDSSDEEEFEEDDVPTPLMPIPPLKKTSQPASRTSTAPTPEGTLKPSDSASQAPYKAVPIQRQKAEKTIASIFSWSEKGSWESLHPDECSIVVTPGLIEAFEMSAAHSRGAPLGSSGRNTDKVADDASNVTSQNDDVQGERPLVALELTPLVPLRRGTAIDISIRSPPTSNSQITAGNNIMFRSRSPEECEALYALINHARIHNPTYIALQNARGPFGPGSSFPGQAGSRPTSQSGKSRSSWFGGLGRSSSYRASTKRTPSISPSETSVGTMSSAFSALRRFGRGNGGGGMFNIGLSTITSRNGADSGASSVLSNSDNLSGSGAATPIAPGMVANKDGSLGLKDAKTRLYIRETASKWRDMGSARLTILQPDNPNIGQDGRPLSGARQKRILVTGKTKGETLLDAQLGESCFERVARTGIAVSVWEDVIGPNGEVGVAGAVGGVAGGRAKVYMIQMRSEAEAAYTFSLVGKLRY